jgi:hypothetical protein
MLGYRRLQKPGLDQRRQVVHRGRQRGFDDRRREDEATARPRSNGLDPRTSEMVKAPGERLELST